MGKRKEELRKQRQKELLGAFEGDFYQEKDMGGEWWIKMWNGNTQKWQVAVYSEKSYRGYKKFSNPEI